MSRLACFVLVASAVTACNQLLPASMTNLTAASAENPLNGQPLRWSQKSTGVPFEGEKACTTWPIEDELTVTATAEQICVKGRVYKVVGAEFGEPTGHSIGIQSDGSGESGMLDGNSGNIPASRARKVGQCFDRGAAKSVWEEPYDACTPNKDVSGKPALTAKSTFLQVGDARWKFPAPEAAPAPAAKASPGK